MCGLSIVLGGTKMTNRRTDEYYVLGSFSSPHGVPYVAHDLYRVRYKAHPRGYGPGPVAHTPHIGGRRNGLAVLRAIRRDGAVPRFISGLTIRMSRAEMRLPRQERLRLAGDKITEAERQEHPEWAVWAELERVAK